jgi:hypothetical protein
VEILPQLPGLAHRALVEAARPRDRLERERLERLVQRQNRLLIAVGVLLATLLLVLVAG